METNALPRQATTLYAQYEPVLVTAF